MYIKGNIGVQRVNLNSESEPPPPPTKNVTKTALNN